MVQFVKERDNWNKINEVLNYLNINYSKKIIWIMSNNQKLK